MAAAASYFGTSSSTAAAAATSSSSSSAVESCHSCPAAYLILTLIIAIIALLIFVKHLLLNWCGIPVNTWMRKRASMGREGGAGTAAAGHHRIQLKRTESLSSSSWSWSTKHSEWFHASLYCLSCNVNLNTPRPGPTNLNTKLSVVDKETMQALSLTSFVWWVAFVRFISRLIWISKLLF